MSNNTNKELIYLIAAYFADHDESPKRLFKELDVDGKRELGVRAIEREIGRKLRTWDPDLFMSNFESNLYAALDINGNGRLTCAEFTGMISSFQAGPIASFKTGGLPKVEVATETHYYPSAIGVVTKETPKILTDIEI